MNTHTDDRFGQPKHNSMRIASQYNGNTLGVIGLEGGIGARGKAQLGQRL
jgi:hypothetical protein